MLAEINEIRELFFNDLIQKPNDFHPDDVERIKHCDWMIKRFLVSNKRNINATAKQLIQVMKWRNDERVNEIKPTQFPMEYFQSGGMFIYGKDKSGARLIITRVKINKRIKEWNEVCKKYIIYLFEGVDREQEKLTLFFDCSNSGLSNVDTELLWFIISLLRNYYPMMLHTILVYELPWVLNFVFKLLHSWLPHDQRQLLHPITKKDVDDFVSPDQLPDFLNGTSDLPYKSTPKHVEFAIDLARQISIGKSAAERLAQQYQPYI